MVIESQKYFWWTLVDDIGRELRDQYLKSGREMSRVELDEVLSGLVDRRIARVDSQAAVNYIETFGLQLDSVDDALDVFRFELHAHALQSFQGFLKHSLA